MFSPGEVVRFYSTTASKQKFHLCLGEAADGPKFAFLFLNSGSGFRGDCVFTDGVIPGLPQSPTGETVVSFSQVVRLGEEKLTKFGAIRTGCIDAATAATLAAFANATPVLTKNERILVVSALRSLCV